MATPGPTQGVVADEALTTHQAARGIALACTGGLLTAVGLAGLGPMAATASSHREAPLISGTPQYDGTDLYAFRSPESRTPSR